MNFLDAYDYKNEMKKYNTDKFVVNFMKPSWRFPVYWTEEWDMQHTYGTEMAVIWLIILKATELHICGAMLTELDLKSIFRQNHL